MKCIEMMELISLYIDDMLDEHMRVMLEKHLSECEECKQAYQDLLSIKALCTELPELQLPSDFESKLHERLIAAKQEEPMEVIQMTDKLKTKKSRWRDWKIYSSIAAILTIAVVSASLSNLDLTRNNNKQEMSKESLEMAQPKSAPAPMEPEAGMYRLQDRGIATEENTEDMAQPFALDQDAQNQNAALPSQELIKDGRKVIKNGYIDLNVEKYNEVFDRITEMAFANGGFVENSNTQFKYYNEENPDESLRIGMLLIRIPENRFLRVMEEVKTLGVVTNNGISGQDITNQYRDTVNEVENLKVQEKRLREIMEQASNVTEVLEVERELTKVRGQINMLSGNIERWDELVSLSTIHINLNEVTPKDKAINPINENLWDIAKKGFIKTINEMVSFAENLLIAGISILPIVFALLAIGIPLIWIGVRKYKRWSAKSKKE